MRTLFSTSRPSGRTHFVQRAGQWLTTNRNEALLEKYGLKANDAILAEEKHLGLYEELLNNYDAKLIAAGAAQNSARGAQVRISTTVVVVGDFLFSGGSLTQLLLLVHPAPKHDRLCWMRRQGQVR